MFGVNVQPHYKQGRGIKTVSLSDIEGICDCGYLTLAPACDVEQHSGGLTVKRSDVVIISDVTRAEVQRLSRKHILSFCNCNACVNDWR